MGDQRSIQSQAFEQKPIRALLWEFAVPNIMAMSATSIYNICDSIIIGRCCGPIALSGQGLTLPLMNILTAFCIMASVGGGVLASIYMGKQDRTTAHHIFGNVLFLNLAFSFVLSVAGLLFLDPILRLFGASSQTLPYARDYMRIILMGVILTHVLQNLLSQLRSSGFPRVVMRAQLIAVAVNILLDILFVYGFGWGVKGAAVATLAGQLFSLLLVLPRFFDQRNFICFTRDVFCIRWQFIRDIFSIGISPFLSNICGFLIVSVINHQLLTYGGNDFYVGTHSVTNRISQLLIMMVVGFSQGLQPIVGYNLGAQRYDRVRAVLREALITSTVITTVGYICLALFPSRLASIFVDDALIIGASAPALRISLITFPLVGSQLIAVTFFQSIHKAKLSVLINLSRQLFFLLPFLFLLPHWLGVNGVWWSMAAADCWSVALSWYLLWKSLKTLPTA